MMNDMLFYVGRGDRPELAVRRALYHATPVFIENPSLHIQLLDLSPTASHWEAHIRLMAVSTGQGKQPKSKPPELEKTPRSPEHFRSGQPFEWRPIGMQSDNIDPVKGFGRATYGSDIPDIPIQNLTVYRGGEKHLMSVNEKGSVVLDINLTDQDKTAELKYN